MGNYMELSERTKCGHIQVIIHCFNCKKLIKVRKTRLRDGAKFCNDCKFCKYEDEN